MKVDLRRVLFTWAALVCFLLVLWFLIHTFLQSDSWDFNVFYSSAQAALHGQSIYTTYGSGDLPYWYFPWVAWAFVPLAFLPFEFARIVFLVLSMLSAIFAVPALTRAFTGKTPLASQAFVLAMSLLMCTLLFKAGQVDFILLAVIVGTILLINNGRTVAAGLLFPILLFKPHLLTIFILFALWRGGKKLLTSASGSVLLVSFLAFVWMPNWPLEMLHMLSLYGRRMNTGIGFATLSDLLGHPENWAGTANLGLTAGLFTVAFASAWKSQHLPTASFLALTLSASMLCAPRAYSYNFPILLPPLVWITAGSAPKTILIWLGAAAIAVIANFSTDTYWIVLVTFVLTMVKAHSLQRVSYTFG